MTRPTTLDLLKEARAALTAAGWGRAGAAAAAPNEWAAVLAVLAEHLPATAPGPDARKVRHAIGDLEVEFSKPRPDPAEVREALDRALRYAGLSGATRFPEAAGPAVERVRSWLADH